MRAILLTLIGLAAAACGLILAPAGLASAESAVVTIGQLQAQGFDVKIDRVGSAPLSECVVTNVRNPRERTEFVPVLGGRDRGGVVPVIVDRTVTVSLDCSRVDNRRGPAGAIRPGLSLFGDTVKKVVHQRVNKFICQRLIRQQQPVIAGTPQLVHHRLGVQVRAQLTAFLRLSPWPLRPLRVAVDEYRCRYAAFSSGSD